jgi:hypothetical protein
MSQCTVSALIQRTSPLSDRAKSSGVVDQDKTHTT